MQIYKHYWTKSSTKSTLELAKELNSDCTTIIKRLRDILFK